MPATPFTTTPIPLIGNNEKAKELLAENGIRDMEALVQKYQESPSDDDFKGFLERQVGQTTKVFQVPMEVGDEFDRDIYTANEYAEYGDKPTAYLPDYIEDEKGNPDYFVEEEDD